MIKFFRHIRQQMIKENRVSKYLLYAIGEIVLVVIGILIALQINNWNTQANQRTEEIKYLKKLKVDLQADIVNLTDLIEVRRTKSNCALELLELPPPQTLIKITSMDSLISKLFGWREYIPHTNTLQELTSSGKFSILQSDSIKTLLINLEEQNRFEATMNEHMKREFHYYLYDRAAHLREMLPTVDLRESFKTSDGFRLINDISQEQLEIYSAQAEAFLNDIVIRNGLKLAASNNNYFIENYRNMIKETEHLIEFIDQDLANGK